jgi:hypothetical protein
MKERELIDALREIKSNSGMEQRILNNCRSKIYKGNFISIPRKTFAVVCSLLLMCFSITVYAAASGLITLKLPGNNYAHNTSYVAELQKSVVTLKPEVKNEIYQFYSDISNNPESKKTFNSFSEAEKFLGVNLLDNSLFKNSQNAINLEVYGDKNKANRVNLISYQTTEEYPAAFPVSAEFAIDEDGNYSRMIASSSETDKVTTLKTYHSKVSGITAQIAVTDNKGTNSYDIEVYFIEGDVLYNFSLLADNSSSINKLMKIAQKIIDGFIS